MSRRIAYLAYALAALLSAATLSSCEDNSVGFITLDSYGVAPPGVASVVLAIRSFELGGNGTHIDINPNEPADVTVDLASGKNIIMSGITVPTGFYKWVRLDIDQADSYVTGTNGDRYALQVPSIYVSDGQFLVGAAVSTEVAVNVDMHRALSVETQNGIRVYTLKPVSQLVTIEDTGQITGAVFPDVMIGSRAVTDSTCDPQVYVFPGGDVTPEGYNVPVPGGVPPLTNATLLLHLPQDIYTYRADLLPVGRYTVALTCAAADTPGSQGIDFTPTVTVKVSAQGVANATFRS